MNSLQSKKHVERINREIKDVEKRMLEQIGSDEKLQENYESVASVKGIALINRAAIPVATQNFTCFENSRKFACYAGLLRPCNDDVCLSFLRGMKQ